MSIGKFQGFLFFFFSSLNSCEGSLTLALGGTLDHITSQDTLSTAFFTSEHITFSQMDHILSYETNHNTFKRTRIIWNMFSDDNSIKLEISNGKLPGKYSIWKLNNTLPSNSGIKDMSQKIANLSNWMKIKTQHFKMCGMPLKWCLGEIFSTKCL